MTLKPLEIALFQNGFILRRPSVGIFTDFIKILTIFI